jgi:hypothetical protein
MEPIHPIFGITILVFALIIIPMIINIGTDKKQEWADGLTFSSAFILALASVFYLHSDLEGKKIFVAPALMILYPMYVHLIFRYLIYVVLRFLIIKPIILLDSSMTAKIEQNKNAIKNSQNNQNNP